MRSVIIGGGVAGFAVGAALRDSNLGSASVLVERRPSGSPGGMGFILMPNGLRALDQIAPEIDWRGAGRVVDEISLRSAGGAVLSHHPIAPAVCVGRMSFLNLLRSAARTTALREGHGVVELERRDDDDGSTAAVRLEDGSSIEGDAFFACDGAASRVRNMMFPEAQLSEVVVKEIVSVAHAPQLAARLGSTFYKFHDEEGGLAVGMLAESETRVVWFIQFDAARWALAHGGAERLAHFAAERTAGWSPEIREALEQTDFTQSHLWPTRDLPPLAELAQQNLALVGDAAHACLPFTSQGANGALVDAAVLQDLLGGARTRADVARAFRLYSEIRRPHHRRMFMEGRRLRAEFLAPMPSGGPCVPLVA